MNKKIGDVCTFDRGLTYSKADEVATSCNGVLRSNNIDLVSNTLCLDEIKYIKESIEIPESKKAKKGSILICMANGSKSHLGKVAIIDIDQEFAFGGFMGLITPTEAILSKYLYYSLITPQYKKLIASLSDGANINNLKFRDIQNFEIPVPSLPEQERIVKKLDEAFAKIDALKQNAEKGLQAVKDLWQATLVKFLCDSQYPQVLFGTTADFVRGPFGGSLTKNMFKASGFAVYEQQHAIHQHVNIRYFIEKRKFDEMKRFQVKPGDLIMSCSGVTLGRAIIIPENAPLGVINQALLKITTKSNMLNEFLLYYIRCKDFQKKIFDYSKGAAIPNVAPVSTLKTIKICLPSFEEQKKIVERLDHISAISQRLQNNYEQELSEYESLKQSILRKAFSGEL
ncbi:MAG: restriction endonuclease subunit S [Paludibacteraceae bacterium]|nr:restriction endonuclease subunit S [Paludibacteraceae bacterium]